MEQSIQVIMVHRRGPESPDLGEAHLGSESPVPGEAKKESTAIRSRWGDKFTRIGCGPDRDQINLVQVIPSGLPELGVSGEDQVRTRFTRSK